MTPQRNEEDQHPDTRNVHEPLPRQGEAGDMATSGFGGCGPENSARRSGFDSRCRLSKETDLTILGWFNFLVAQWLFVRLARIVDHDGSTVGWKLLGFVVPMTGWWNDCRFLGIRRWMPLNPWR